MTKTISYRYAAIFLVTLAVMITMTVVLVNASRQVIQRQSEAVAQINEIQRIPELRYQVKAYEGHIALWREGAAKPYRVLSAETWLLSEADRLAVEEGIFAEDAAELERLLEDLGAEE